MQSLVKTASGRVTASRIRDELLDKCRKRLPHQVGQIFTRCILTCFNFAGLTSDLDEYEQQLYFQRHVVGEIFRSVGHV